jgi:DNA helicase II / ATP-dependent DNA helicase PcrA
MDLNRCRGRMIDRNSWPARVREFESRWSQYKRAAGLLDFCDLIESCLENVSVAPGNPRVICADEVQDSNRLQVAVLRKWRRRADYSVFAFDDDQAVYGFIGADPEVILDPEVPESHKVILTQSYRVPRAVHQLADRFIRQLSTRQPKMYQPRPEEGQVIRLGAGSYKSPEYYILPTATKHLAQGEKVMFLASSSYMLMPLLAVLRKAGIPYHNPFRKANGYLNPLRPKSRGSAVRRTLSLLVGHPGWDGEARGWTCREILSWSEWLRPTGVLRPGARDFLSAHPGAKVTPELLAAVFETDALESLLKARADGYPALLRWWRGRLATQFQKRAAFPVEIALRRGPHGLIDDPAVIVGTVHSVKGAEADVVYLFPDLSKAGDAQYQRHGPPRDSVIRLFYVGATRARETLYICSAQGSAAVSI